MSQQPCATCHGAHLFAEVRAVTLGCLTISEIGQLTIVSALQTLHAVGLDYLKLGQNATTLSGDEAGGQLIAQGPPELIANTPSSYTSHFLKEAL